MKWNILGQADCPSHSKPLYETFSFIIDWTRWKNAGLEHWMVPDYASQDKSDSHSWKTTLRRIPISNDESGTKNSQRKKCDLLLGEWHKAYSIRAFCLFRRQSTRGTHAISARIPSVLIHLVTEDLPHRTSNCLSHTTAIPTYASHIASLVLKRRYVLFSSGTKRKEEPLG